MTRNLTLAALAVALAGLSTGAMAQDVAKGETIFKRCGACHAVGEGAANKAGPELNGIVGRKFGVAPSYAYSDNLKELAGQGRVWDEATLNSYLENVKGMIPKGKMAFAGLKKEDERKNVIAYLAQFDEAGKKK